MTELTFTKTVLQSLDPRPIKIPSTHTGDPHQFPLRHPYTLPHYPSSKPMSRPSHLSDSAPGTVRTLTISIHSLRNSSLDGKLKDVAPETSIMELKGLIAGVLGESAEKVRLLWKKKPVGNNTKTVAEVVGEDAKEGKVLEFSVMVVGGGTPQEEKKDVEMVGTAQGPSGKEMLASEEFWVDLKGFLVQRLKDEEEGGKLFETFKTAWEEKGR
ncbi:MAG: hypothetical protein M1834_001852 [Cirrosporium novae-zelandiae]|nr:MAG: hypothetical protein M1834_001852 [Cirrosporium novae-zelandiae]